MQVKICDYDSRDFKKDFLNSILNTGFAVVKNHGLSPFLIKDVQQMWKNFFLSQDYKKTSYVNGNDPGLGYFGFKKEQALGAQVADLKEFFHYYPGSALPGGTEGVTEYLYENLEAFSSVLLNILDEGHLDKPFSYDDACYLSDKTILRTIYYPALNFELEKGAVRSAAHEDINFITLLVAASAPGLEVKDLNGKWHSVPHEENSIIVNIGDQLQLASKGFYKSTTHRVINPEDSSQDRISMPLFVHPRSTTLLAPGITAKDFLQERIDAITRK